jgi:hypothetical protein
MAEGQSLTFLCSLRPTMICSHDEQIASGKIGLCHALASQGIAYESVCPGAAYHQIGLDGVECFGVWGLTSAVCHGLEN